MIDHVSLQVQDLFRSKTFYELVLDPLGYSLIVQRPSTVGFGKRYPELWLNLRAELPKSDPKTGAHICLRAHSEEAVFRFHEVALAEGGQDDGAPGPRSASMNNYFGAFIKDLDGNRVEAATFPKKMVNPS